MSICFLSLLGFKFKVLFPTLRPVDPFVCMMSLFSGDDEDNFGEDQQSGERPSWVASHCNTFSTPPKSKTAAAADSSNSFISDMNPPWNSPQMLHRVGDDDEGDGFVFKTANERHVPKPAAVAKPAANPQAKAPQGAQKAPVSGAQSAMAATATAATATAATATGAEHRDQAPKTHNAPPEGQEVDGPFGLDNVQRAVNYLAKPMPVTINGCKCPMNEQKAAEWNLTRDSHVVNLANAKFKREEAKGAAKVAKRSRLEPVPIPTVMVTTEVPTALPAPLAPPLSPEAGQETKPKILNNYHSFMQRTLKEMPYQEGQSNTDRMKAAAVLWSAEKKRMAEASGNANEI